MCVYIEQMRCLYHVQSDPQKCWHPVFTALKNIKRGNFGEIGKVYLKCWARCLFLCFIFWRAAKFSQQIFAAQSKESRAKARCLCNAIRMGDGRWSNLEDGE